MSDITITASNVAIAPGTPREALDTITIGESVVEGEVLYLKSSDSKWWKADANAAGAPETANVRRMALTDGSADDTIIALKPGYLVKLGSVLTATEVYNLSVNAGKVAPHSDLASSSYHTPLGRATTTSLFYFDPKPTGIQKA